MKTVLIVIAALVCLFLVVFIFCACQVSGAASRQEEAMFEEWYANHTEEPKKEAC